MTFFDMCWQKVADAGLVEVAIIASRTFELVRFCAKSGSVGFECPAPDQGWNQIIDANADYSISEMCWRLGSSS